MQLPIVLLCIVAVASAAPQLFFVVPQQFLENPTQQNFQDFIPLIVPFAQQQSETAPVIQEAPAAVEETLTQSQGSEPTAEAAVEAIAPELEADVAAVAAEEQATDIVTEQPEVVVDPQQEQAVEETVPQEGAVESDIVPDTQAVEGVQEDATLSEVVAPELSNIQEPEQSAVDTPTEITDTVSEVIPETAPSTGSETPALETSVAEGETADVQTNEITAQETVEKAKPEEALKAEVNSGKSFNSLASPNSIHHSIVTHFGFRDAASVKIQPNTFTQHGVLVDPRTLVPVQFRHFIYQNDSPDVLSAKIAFFRVQDALTPRKPAVL